LICFPILGKPVLPDEKVGNEASVMKFIPQKTSITVPSIVGDGMGIDNPTGLGPFIIMTFVEGRKMSDILKAKMTTTGDDDILDLEIDESILKALYGQLADILPELFNAWL
jgi:hypothetical protein